MKQLRTKEGLPDIENLRTKAPVKVMPVVDFLLLPKLFQKSRMMGDYQVRFCEGLGGKCPGSTRQFDLPFYNNKS